MSDPSPAVTVDLAGKVAIVTGASRGIGKDVALALARSGAAVCCAARSEKARAGLPGSIHETREAIEAIGGTAIAVKTDVRSEEAIRAAVSAAAERLGGVDILVHNAGALFWKGVAETPTKRFDLVMDVNARAAFIAARECLPLMKVRGGGHIVFFSPPVDLRFLSGKVAYFLSKFSMTMIAHGLAGEVKDDRIAVNALWPATLIESQATINHRLGAPALWRKPQIVTDALLALLARDAESCTGKALLDEEVLREAGITDFERYNCVIGGNPAPITGDGGLALWRRATHRLNEEEA